MQPGDKVAIYRQPINSRDLEGIAYLRKLVRFDRWVVQFEDGRPECVRIVFSNHKVNRP